MPIDPITPGSFVTVRPDPAVGLTTYATVQAPTATMLVTAAHLQSLSQVVINIANSTLNTAVGGTYFPLNPVNFSGSQFVNFANMSASLVRPDRIQFQSPGSLEFLLHGPNESFNPNTNFIFTGAEGQYFYFPGSSLTSDRIWKWTNTILARRGMAVHVSLTPQLVAHDLDLQRDDGTSLIVLTTNASGTHPRSAIIMFDGADWFLFDWNVR